MKLSVIIPVYRVEQTVLRCLESVALQDVPEMEIIIVDDGSPDRAPQLCEEWAARHKGMAHVIHQDNRGLSAARNTGLAAATGDYVTFVDSDDYLAPDTYKPLAQLLQGHPEYDLLEYPFCAQTATDKSVVHSFSSHTYTDMGLYWMVAQTYTHCYAWNKIYRRRLFTKVSFPEGKLFEDAWTLPLLLSQAHTVAQTDQGMYHYCLNMSGITQTADCNALSSLFHAHLRAMQTLQPQVHDPHAADDYYLYLLNLQVYLTARSKEPIALPYRRIADTRRLRGVRRLKAIINNRFGINTLCNIIKATQRLQTLRS